MGWTRSQKVLEVILPEPLALVVPEQARALVHCLAE